MLLAQSGLDSIYVYATEMHWLTTLYGTNTTVQWMSTDWLDKCSDWSKLSLFPAMNIAVSAEIAAAVFVSIFQA